MTVLDVLKNPAIAAEIKKQQKHVILLWLAGGATVSYTHLTLPTILLV